MAKDLSQVKHVYWFESAFDAMAFYQIKKAQLDETISGYEQMQNEGSYKGDQEIKEFTRELFDLKKSVFVSTGGNPSMQQFKGMLAETPTANHHLCFDRDMAGRMFALNFLIAKSDKELKATLQDNGLSTISDGFHISRKTSRTTVSICSFSR
jgi:hypothetical protein